MAQLTITISDPDQAQEIADAFHAKLGVPATVAGVKSALMDYAKGIVRQYRQDQAVAEAAQTAANEADPTLT
jgi:hypothetical protein